MLLSVKNQQISTFSVVVKEVNQKGISFNRNAEKQTFSLKMAEILNVSCKKPLGPSFSLLWGCYVVPLDTFSSSFSCISQKEWICNPQKNIVHWNSVVNLSYSFCIFLNSILFEHNLLIYSFHSFPFPRTRTRHRTDIAVSFFVLI